MALETREQVWLERVPLDWERQPLMPWSLPPGLYYLTPWAWVRAYLRIGDWLLWRVWCATRPVMWWLEDRALALDAELLEQARRGK